MKPTELRIGNLFWGAGMVQTVKEMHKYGDQPGYEYLIMCEENGNQYKPIEMQGIPLTEEWLKKFGFNRQGDRNVWILDKVSVTLMDYPDLHGKLTGDKFYLGFRDCGGVIYRTTIPVPYVHILQNAFALTGKELEIK